MEESDNRTFADKVSDGIAKFGGSWYFIITGFAVLIGWIIVNTLAVFDEVAWDKPPFILMNLVLSCIAAFQAPFIMMSQNRNSIKQDTYYRNLLNEIKAMIEKDLDISSADWLNIHKMLTEMDKNNNDNAAILNCVEEIRDTLNKTKRRK